MVPLGNHRTTYGANGYHVSFINVAFIYSSIFRPIYFIHIFDDVFADIFATVIIIVWASIVRGFSSTSNTYTLFESERRVDDYGKFNMFCDA